MKKLSIIATLLCLIGVVILAVAFTFNGWDFTKLGSGKHETNVHDINEDFYSITIKTDTADIDFLPSEDEKCKVICYEEKNMKHSVSVNDGTLTISVVDTRKWYEYISWFSSPKLTVYLPESEYSSLIIEEDTGDIKIPSGFRFENVDISLSTGDVWCSASVSGNTKIASSTGDIVINDTTLGSLQLSVSTGDIFIFDATCGDIKIDVSTGETELMNVTCKNLTTMGSTGDIELTKVVASGSFSIKRSTGDVEFSASDAAEILIETSTGDVEGSLLSEKIFAVETDTGKKEVPKTTSGGICEITTDTGDVKIYIKK